jgi:hypothetical protein
MRAKPFVNKPKKTEREGRGAMPHLYRSFKNDDVPDISGTLRQVVFALLRRQTTEERE